jgi:catechol 2,3-dioxygenase-like lactoylglutathione lyase family enzyme
MKLNNIHHIAIICSDYEKSKDFYIRVLGLKHIREVYRNERQSYMITANKMYHLCHVFYQQLPLNVPFLQTRLPIG